ncbi:DUF3489 domain-containing protein [Magnetospirillum sp. SS-4]|uniref:DUF3489 domain-containing protein n=1 Tax=Magnetospirillum sp. SS-4 TaxID=2681465 RepID=UPI0013856B53|nr:DUF3489 domain-containing protein [Magnetospirillum sp. SS-4]CAA7619723.1 conserved hypothetical protein [Magnetospirillum sp. SS-4]
MTQLSDTQAVILSAACSREGGFLLPITASLKGGAVNMVLNSLIKKELAEEIPAEPGMPVWREDEDGTPFTLRATPAAYTALGMVADTGADSGPEEEPATDMADQPETAPLGAQAPNCSMAAEPPEADGANTPRKTRQGTKQEALIAMLKRPEGASIDEIAAEFGWANHTIRGAIAGALKKKLGLTITSEKLSGRGRTYRIAE